MDHQALDAYKALWNQESRQVVHDLPCLTPEERRLFDELRDNRLGIGSGWSRSMWGWVGWRTRCH
ncbi:DUF2220 family protein [Pseudomonas sp. Xaverov 259]|uniref:DUF2220 family protein n=1 Tax=Pseudomonas sp. Xaverov 259 TaxID=2666086 RepID=UPI001C5B694A